MNNARSNHTLVGRKEPFDAEVTVGPTSNTAGTRASSSSAAKTDAVTNIQRSVDRVPRTHGTEVNKRTTGTAGGGPPEQSRDLDEKLLIASTKTFKFVRDSLVLVEKGLKSVGITVGREKVKKITRRQSTTSHRREREALIERTEQ